MVLVFTFLVDRTLRPLAQFHAISAAALALMAGPAWSQSLGGETPPGMVSAGDLRQARERVAKLESDFQAKETELASALLRASKAEMAAKKAQANASGTAPSAQVAALERITMVAERDVALAAKATAETQIADLKRELAQTSDQLRRTATTGADAMKLRDERDKLRRDSAEQRRAIEVLQAEAEGLKGAADKLRSEGLENQASVRSLMGEVNVRLRTIASLQAVNSQLISQAETRAAELQEERTTVARWKCEAEEAIQDAKSAFRQLQQNQMSSQPTVTYVPGPISIGPHGQFIPGQMMPIYSSSGSSTVTISRSFGQSGCASAFGGPVGGPGVPSSFTTNPSVPLSRPSGTLGN